MAQRQTMTQAIVACLLGYAAMLARAGAEMGALR
jgi:hypothetical protein